MLGGLLGGKVAGAALGGALGDAFDLRQQQRRADRREDTNVMRLVEQAKAVGLNPLTVLGSSAASYQAPTVPMPAFGTALAEGAAERTRRELEERNLAATARRAEAEATIAEYTAANVGRASLAGVLNSRPGIREAVERDAIPLEVPYRTRSGEIVWGPNPELPSNDQWLAPPYIAGLHNPASEGLQAFEWAPGPAPATGSSRSGAPRRPGPRPKGSKVPASRPVSRTPRGYQGGGGRSGGIPRW